MMAQAPDERGASSPDDASVWHWRDGIAGLRARYGRPMLWTALGISIGIHILGILLSMVILFHGGGGSGSGRGEGDDISGGGGLQMAIATEGGLTAMGEVGEQMPLVPTTTGTEEIATPAVIGDATASIAGSTSLSDSAGSLAGGGDVGSGGGFGGGTGGSGGGGGASFFGVEAQGKRFAFIVDISASMEAEGKFARLKQELRKTITGLGESSEYFIATFADDSRPLGGRIEWSEATTSVNRRTFNAIETMVTGASTRPLPAFQMVFRIRPKPDAIYFMTDGEFEESVVEEVALLNRAAGGVPIHSICFASQAGEDLMQKIAKQSKGTYTFVPGNAP